MSGLPAEFHGHVAVRLVPSTEPEAKAAVAANGWRSHGLVIERGEQVVYRAGDHRVSPYDAQLAIATMLGWGPECRGPPSGPSEGLEASDEP